MRSYVAAGHVLVAGLLWVLVPTLGLLAAPASEKPPETPADKIRKTLDQPLSVNFKEQTLRSVLNELSDKTKVKLVLDPGIFGNANVDDVEIDLHITAKAQDTPLRSVLRTMLAPRGLGFVVLKDTITVTLEERVTYLQLRQTVSLDLEEVPLATALKRLARDTHTNLVLDPRVAKEAKGTPVSLQVEDVPLETAVRLVAEVAGLKAARVGTVVFVTTEARADKIRAEPDLLPGPDGQHSPGPYYAVPRRMVAPRLVAPPVPIPAPAAPAAPAPAPRGGDEP
jgi:type II secretory pathway component HofQ